MTSPYHSDNAVEFRQHLSTIFSDLDGAKQFMRDYVLKHGEKYPLEEFQSQTLSQYRLMGNISLSLDPQLDDVITSPRQTRYFYEIETAYNEALREKLN
jgi:hypothetical protein